MTLGILTALLFFLGPIYNIINASYRLGFVPDAFQGRVNSAARLMSFASQPLGLAATGVLIQSIGTSRTTLIGAGVLLFVALIATASSHIHNAAQYIKNL